MNVKRRCDVLVIGAGPVGLASALSLVERGVDLQILDKEWRGSSHSYALALHPASLDLLDRVGVVDELVRQGERVERIAFYDDALRFAALDYGALGGRFPYLLVVPQSAVEQALVDRLRRAKVEVLWNHEAQATGEESQGVVTRVARLEKVSTGYPIARSEWMVARETEVHSRFLIGADGYHSFVRRACHWDLERVGPSETFAVFEFISDFDLDHEARVVFHAGTTNVVWPLGGGRMRFSFAVPADAPPTPDAENLRRLLRERAPWFDREPGEILWTAVAVFERRLTRRFGAAHIWLAGDAAHITGPVGGQSMNVGLREGVDLACRIARALEAPGELAALERYETERRSEWRRLFDLDAPTPDRMLPCIPASGPDLDRLLAQF